MLDSRVVRIRLEDVPVVRDFSDVFLDDLPRLPLEREINFAIDLVSRIIPISFPPYCMALVELRKLKIQLQELIGNGFFRRAHFVYEEER